MIGPRIEIKAVCETLTPLMIGSGKRETLEGDPEERLLTLVARDASGRPYIPGSSIKGVLRRLADHAVDLFGPDDINENSHGRSGNAIFWDAYQIVAEEAVARQSRTSIDDDSGTAEAGRLFTEEYVKPGTEFGLEIFLDDRGEGHAEGMKHLLSVLSAEEGVQIGSDTRQNCGRIRIKAGSLKIQEKTPGKPAQPLDWKISASVLEGFEKTIPLRLICDGPFLILDSERTKERTTREDAHLLAMIDFDSKGPRLTGTTLMGALRAAFEWHIGETGAQSPSEWLADRAPTPVDRLFGTTLWRGLVEIAAITPSGDPVRQNIPSVKIDRFSGAPMDNALFFTEGWIGAAFDVTLRVRNRTAEGRYEEETFFEDLGLLEGLVEMLADSTWGGLDLGHGTNRGYGWFSVERLDQREQAA